jgi:hypothetical protein
MEYLPTKSLNRNQSIAIARPSGFNLETAMAPMKDWGLHWFWGFALLTLLCGCVSSPKVGAKKTKVDPNQPVQLATTWNPKVQTSSDPTRGGVHQYCLSGRLFLFGANPSYPLITDGKLVVDLWDHTNVAKGSEPKLLEQWQIDPETLKSMIKEDVIGQGYSIALPWGTYRPDISQIHLIVRFDPVKGNSMMHQSTISVDHTQVSEAAFSVIK